MEIRAGTGGDEAALFARDLYEMYSYYAETKGWKIEIMDHSPTELGGFKEMVIAIEGEGVYRELQYESGGHRVQRVPRPRRRAASTRPPRPSPCCPSRKTSRSRSSPTTIAWTRSARAAPAASTSTRPNRPSGSRTTRPASSCSARTRRASTRTTPRPSACSRPASTTSRSKQEDAKRAAERKTLVGSGDRSERIRTYNFPQNRLTDHRIGLTLYKLDQIIAGNLQPVTDALIDYDRQQLRDQMGGLD